MKTNKRYQRPEINIIDVEPEEIIATSPQSGIGITDEKEDNIEFRSRKRLWDE